MKTNLLQKSAAACIGAAFALSAMTARADEPKKDDTTTTRKHAAAKTAHGTDPAEKTTFTTVIPTRDGKNSIYVTGGVVGGGTGPEYAVLTGSQLPRHYTRHAYTTDSSSSEYIIDQNDQRLQGTNSVPDALRSVPGINVGGMR